MKYVQGRPLDSVIRDVGPLPIPMVQAIVAQVGDALGYAHRHGVIHRDVKSANIMLDEEGWAVVTDFGIAKVLQAQGLTMTGVTVGTPTYMSPEQCATEEVTTLDRKSTRLNSSHPSISYAVFCLKKKNQMGDEQPVAGIKNNIGDQDIERVADQTRCAMLN